MKITSTMLRKLIKEEMSNQVGILTFTVEITVDATDLIYELGPEVAKRKCKFALSSEVEELEDRLTQIPDVDEIPIAVRSVTLK